MKRLSFSILTVAILAGCANPQGYSGNTELRKDVLSSTQQRAAQPAVALPDARVVETPGAYIPVTLRKNADTGWLREQRVTVQVGNQPVPLTEILRIMARQGLNITSELALDRYMFAGFSMNDTDAETALRMVLASVGLDYYVDSNRRLITVKPMASRTWYLNIGNRRTVYASGGTSGAPSVSNSDCKPGQTTGSPGSSALCSSEDFWASLKTELDSRLQVMLPDNKAAAPVAAAAIPALVPGVNVPLVLPPTIPVPGKVPAAGGASAAAAAGAAAGASAPTATATAPATAAPPAPAAPATVSAAGVSSFSPKQIGNYSVNPETGAVHVQAPHWLLDELDTYMKRVQEMYNTDIVFQGELLMLSSDQRHSEGLDISQFARFANNKYGFVYQNNALGGVTVSIPRENIVPGTLVSAAANSLLPSIATGSGVAGPMLGLRSIVDGLQLFNAYLSQMGTVTSLQRPVLTTTSGVPADFRRTVTRYYNSVSQAVASGTTGGAAVGTTNTLVGQEFGTVLRVNPRIDVTTGLIRAQIELTQTSQLGNQSVQQSLSAGSGVQQVTTQVPIVSKILYSGEALLRDGDLIVMGGQAQDNEQSDRAGIPHLMDSTVAGGLFGQASKTAQRDVFYFAMRVSVNKRQ